MLIPFSQTERSESAAQKAEWEISSFSKIALAFLCQPEFCG